MAAGRLPLTAADPCHPGLLFGVGGVGGGCRRQNTQKELRYQTQSLLAEGRRYVDALHEARGLRLLAAVQLSAAGIRHGTWK